MGAGSATVTLGTTRSIDGPLTSADRPESHATLSASWAPVRTRIVVDTQTIDLKWTLRVDQPGPATWVDDLMVWPSADGSCAE